jgi:hypothetical protein
VWVTITRVRAHRSSSAEPHESGWVDLIDRRDDPVQVDLLNLPGTECLLTQLGSTTGLPTGHYQQLRLILLEASPAPGTPVPAVNRCSGTGSWHCVSHVSEGLHELELGSQDRSGIKVPPGRIAGGAIVLRRDRPADLNLEFDACNSIVRMGNGRFRLRPTLHAGEVSVTEQIIRGRAVNATNGLPIAGATVLALAEMPDSDGIDRVVGQTVGNSTDGTFALCPVPMGTIDVVVTARDATGQTYGATMAFSVPHGTNLGDVPLFPVPAGTAGTLAGTVTSSAPGNLPAGADVELTALQMAVPPGRPALLVTVPVFPGSTAVVATEAGGSCPPGTSCAGYTLVVPARNPSIGVFAPGGTTYAAPAAGSALYSVSGRAFIPMSGGLPNCMPALLVTNLDGMGMPLAALPGGNVTVATLGFTGCQPDP